MKQKDIIAVSLYEEVGGEEEKGERGVKSISNFHFPSDENPLCKPVRKRVFMRNQSRFENFPIFFQFEPTTPRPKAWAHI